MFINTHFIQVCSCVVVISLRSYSDCNKEATYLLTTFLSRTTIRFSMIGPYRY